MPYFLEARNIVKRYKNHTALSDVSIQVKPASVFGLLGPNGAGKSTLIKIINKILLADSGTVLMDGREMTYEDIRHIGYLPEERGLYKKMRVGDHAIYLARLHGLSRRDARSELTRWFEKFNIMPWWNKKVEELSKGMQQKVQFICTVIHRPKLLIFDEPFSGFDPVNTALLKDEILALRDEGCAVIFSTHNMQSVEEICDDIVLINQSKLVLSGRVGEIRRRFARGTVSLLLDGDGYRPDWIASFDSRETGVPAITPEGSNMRVRFPDAALCDVRTLANSMPPDLKILEIVQETPSMQDIFIQIVAPHSEDGKRLLSYDELNTARNNAE